MFTFKVEEEEGEIASYLSTLVGRIGRHSVYILCGGGGGGGGGEGGGGGGGF